MRERYRSYRRTLWSTFVCDCGAKCCRGQVVSLWLWHASFDWLEDAIAALLRHSEMPVFSRQHHLRNSGLVLVLPALPSLLLRLDRSFSLLLVSGMLARPVEPLTSMFLCYGHYYYMQYWLYSRYYTVSTWNWVRLSPGTKKPLKYGGFFDGASTSTASSIVPASVVTLYAINGFSSI